VRRVTITDPAHPLYGRRLRVVLIPRSAGTMGHVFLAGPGDTALRIPIAATSLQPVPVRPSSKLSLAAIRDLLRVAARATCPTAGSDETGSPARRVRR